jgi:acyl transferase domain-containing protein
MAAVFAGADAVRGVLAMAGLPDVWIANQNCPEQTVVSGARASIEAILPHFVRAGLEARALGVEVGWHTPLAAELGQERALAAFTALETHPPRVRMLSNVQGEPYEPGEDCGKSFGRNLAAQLGAPMDFTSLIERAYALGVTSFVEVGPKRIVTGFVGEILRARPHRLFFLSHPKSSEREQLSSVARELKR